MTIDMTAFEEARAEAEQLLSSPGVIGIGEGETPDGDRSIVVMVTSLAEVAESGIPAHIGEVPVEILATGVIAAEADDDDDAPPDGGSCLPS